MDLYWISTRNRRPSSPPPTQQSTYVQRVPRAIQYLSSPTSTPDPILTSAPLHHHANPPANHFSFPLSTILGPSSSPSGQPQYDGSHVQNREQKTPPDSIRFYRRRPLDVASGVGKVSALGLRYIRPELRRHSPLLSSSSRIHPVSLRPARTRSISYSSIPRFVAQVFRVPIAGVTVGAGGLVYADYKFGGTLSPTLSRSIAQQLPSVRQDLATSLDHYLQRPHRRRARYRERYPC